MKIFAQIQSISRIYYYVKTYPANRKSTFSLPDDGGRQCHISLTSKRKRTRSDVRERATQVFTEKLNLNYVSAAARALFRDSIRDSAITNSSGDSIYSLGRAIKTYNEDLNLNESQTLASEEAQSHASVARVYRKFK